MQFEKECQRADLCREQPALALLNQEVCNQLQQRREETPIGIALLLAFRRIAVFSMETLPRPSLVPWGAVTASPVAPMLVLVCVMSIAPVVASDGQPPDFWGEGGVSSELQNCVWHIIGII